MLNEYNTLLMDLGNVLFRVETDLIESGLQAKGVDTESLARQEFMPLCMRYESGEIDTRCFLDAFSSLTGLPENQLVDVWNGIFPDRAVIDETYRACVRLREAGIRVVAFSNTNELHVEYLCRQYPAVMGMFSDRIYSYLSGDIKPGPGMYLDAVDRLGINPAEALYFDDKPENIARGREFGIDSHVFDMERPETFFDRLPRSWRDLTS